MTRSPLASPESAALAPRPGGLLDVRGLNCPLPVLKARKALRSVAPGAVLTVLATDPAAAIDFRHFCETGPYELVSAGEKDGVLTFKIRAPG